MMRTVVIVVMRYGASVELLPVARAARAPRGVYLAVGATRRHGLPKNKPNKTEMGTRVCALSLLSVMLYQYVLTVAVTVNGVSRDYAASEAHSWLQGAGGADPDSRRTEALTLSLDQLRQHRRLVRDTTRTAPRGTQPYVGSDYLREIAAHPGGTLESTAVWHKGEVRVTMLSTASAMMVASLDRRAMHSGPSSIGGNSLARTS